MGRRRRESGEQRTRLLGDRKPRPAPFDLLNWRHSALDPTLSGKSTDACMRAPRKKEEKRAGREERNQREERRGLPGRSAVSEKQNHDFGEELHAAPQSAPRPLRWRRLSIKRPTGRVRLLFHQPGAARKPEIPLTRGPGIHDNGVARQSSDC
ncbi:hypothetical protein AAFF_G00141830 [Aldrovandia affinis]|uniref:Uncharacterized protein n=1 Tax=Aldrovandia affinis TaxID=143900 RepID=A0AAD7TCI8_9TELE|nr:hypothetical protein AAFF_G00141830 [Aldrovandia affinis]